MFAKLLTYLLTLLFTGRLIAGKEMHMTRDELDTTLNVMFVFALILKSLLAIIALGGM